MSLLKTRLLAISLLIFGFGAGYFVVPSGILTAVKLPASAKFSSRFPYRLGLDLAGGTHLVYRADTSELLPTDISEAMRGLRDTIERRVNFFGVTEPVIQAQQSGDEQRLIVELAGVTDINQAIQLIGRTPFLEFRTERPEAGRDALLKAAQAGEQLQEDPYFIPTTLTGRFLKKASLDFTNPGDGAAGGGIQQTVVDLEFDDDGTKALEKISKANVGKQIAIYLDGIPIQVAVVREEITSGRAQISGNFTPSEARDLVRALNSGALPVPIELISQQNVGAVLGEEALRRGVRAGVLGLLAVVVFLLLWYRLPGVLAVVALGIYGAIILSIFKIVPVTLTAAGIAGFILSIGMAVDANILIFERIKEELREQKTLFVATREGFRRAWPSIRDSNISSLISAVILFQFGTSVVRGFALVLGIGILVSMFSAITATRTFLFALGMREQHGSTLLFRKSAEVKHEP